MPDVTFTLSAAHLTRLVDAVAFVDGYQPRLEGGAPNPETKSQFAKRMIGLRLKDLVRGYENEAAQRALPPAPEIDIT